MNTITVKGIDLLIGLTDKEISDREEECTRKVDELGKIEERYKQVKKGWNANIKKLKTEIDELSTAAVNGQEYRTVDCHQIFDVSSKTTWYEYEGSKYDERKMNDYEIAKYNQPLLFAENPIDEPSEDLLI